MNMNELKDYLDKCIRLWRKRKNEAVDEEDEHTAACYVDAFQSVWVSVFGELLPLEVDAE